MIYLATPYSHTDPAVREKRFETACRIMAALMSEGWSVFAPIVYSHRLALHCALPLDWDYWKKFDTEMLESCDELWVVKMEGWSTSKGIAAEIAIAIELGKKIIYMNETELTDNRLRK